MEFKTYTKEKQTFVEIISEDIIINNLGEALDILANVYYQGGTHIIMKKHNFCEDFFDLKTKLAGDILQKFSNYKMRLTIIGDFENVKSNSLKAFIKECNRGKLICFANKLEDIK